MKYWYKVTKNRQCEYKNANVDADADAAAVVHAGRPVEWCQGSSPFRRCRHIISDSRFPVADLWWSGLQTKVFSQWLKVVSSLLLVTPTFADTSTRPAPVPAKTSSQLRSCPVVAWRSSRSAWKKPATRPTSASCHVWPTSWRTPTAPRSCPNGLNLNILSLLCLKLQG